MKMLRAKFMNRVASIVGVACRKANDYIDSIHSMSVGCLFLALSSAAFAQQGAVDDSFQNIMGTATTCFTGAWADSETYANMVTKRNVNDSDARAEAIQRYNAMAEAYECHWFDYSVDGYDIRGFFSKPRGLAAEPLPVVIYNRGGNADNGALPMRFIVGKLFPLVKEGFVVIGSMYRGASLDGSPHSDRLADEFGGKDVDDVLALLPIIDAMPFANDSQIGIWGTSRGGMMAYLAARRSDRFLALVAEGTPTDLQFELKFRPEMTKVLSEWIPDYSLNRDSKLQERSAIRWADELPQSMSILVLHGTADQKVSANSALAMAVKLQDLNKPYRLVMFENGGHGLHRTHQEDVTREVVEWFKLKLTDRPRFPTE